MQLAKIRLRKPTRVFTFKCNFDIRRGEECIVRSDRGLEFGYCIVPPEPCSEEEDKRYKMSVVRRATHGDLSTFEQIKQDEKRAFDICQKKIEARQLPMKLVDAEYTFDKYKVIFYFTADNRVDFRQLVRDLAAELRTRIEMRHIQVRDQAKLVGGLGVCGRELCCSTFLTEFKPISMKMAKRQNLSLNPSKISGQCGRLLCCLAYENEVYQTQRAAQRAQILVPDIPDDDVEAAGVATTGGEPIPLEDDADILVSAVNLLAEDDGALGGEEVFAGEEYPRDEEEFPEPRPGASAPPEEAQETAQRKRRRKRRKRQGRGGGEGGGHNRPSQN